MLSCKKCGATMSGVDLVCKKCGTPWGKTGKSKAPVFISILLVLIISLGVLYITNNELFYKIIPVDYFKEILSSSKTQNDITENNKVEEQLPPETPTPPPAVEEPKVEEPKVEEPIVEDPKVEEPEIILPPVFTSVTASSSLASQGKFSYTPDLIIDNDNTTAWLEGKKGNGINEYIKFSAETEQTVSGIKIFNGYQKNKTTYINNGRLKKIKIEFSDGSSLTYDLPNQNYNESLNGIDIPFENVIKTSSIKITILDVFKGVYYTDTAVNQINIY